MVSKNPTTNDPTARERFRSAFRHSAGDSWYPSEMDPLSKLFATSHTLGAFNQFDIFRKTGQDGIINITQATAQIANFFGLLNQVASSAGKAANEFAGLSNVLDAFPEEIRDLKETMMESWGREVAAYYHKALPPELIHALPKLYRTGVLSSETFKDITDNWSTATVDERKSFTDKLEQLKLDKLLEQIKEYGKPTTNQTAAQLQYVGLASAIADELYNPTFAHIKKGDYVAALTELVTGPGMRTGGLSAKEVSDLATLMSKYGFTAPRSEYLWTTPFDSYGLLNVLPLSMTPLSDAEFKNLSQDDREELIKSRQEYVFRMSRVFGMAKNIFGDVSPEEMLTRMNMAKMGDGPYGHIYKSDTTDLERRILNIGLIAKRYDADPTAVNKGILHNLAVLQHASGGIYDPITGKRTEVAAHDMAVHVEALTRGVIKKLDMTDPESSRRIRTSIAGVVANTGLSPSGQQLDIFAYMAEKHPEYAKAYQQYVNLLQGAGTEAASDFFYKTFPQLHDTATFRATAEFAKGNLGGDTRKRLLDIRKNTGITELAQMFLESAQAAVGDSWGVDYTDREDKFFTKNAGGLFTDSFLQDQEKYGRDIAIARVEDPETRRKLSIAAMKASFQAMHEGIIASGDTEALQNFNTYLAPIRGIVRALEIEDPARRAKQMAIAMDALKEHPLAGGLFNEILNSLDISLDAWRTFLETEVPEAFTPEEYDELRDLHNKTLSEGAKRILGMNITDIDKADEAVETLFLTIFKEMAHLDARGDLKTKLKALQDSGFSKEFENKSADERKAIAARISDAVGGVLERRVGLQGGIVPWSELSAEEKEKYGTEDGYNKRYSWDTLTDNQKKLFKNPEEYHKFLIATKEGELDKVKELIQVMGATLVLSTTGLSIDQLWDKVKNRPTTPSDSEPEVPPEGSGGGRGGGGPSDGTKIPSKLQVEGTISLTNRSTQKLVADGLVDVTVSIPEE